MKEILLHWRNFRRFIGLLLLVTLLFRRLDGQFYLVPLVETSWDPHSLLALTYFMFLFLPWILAVVYFRHSPNRYVRLVSRMVMVFPLIIGGFALNSYLQGYELLLWTPLLLIRRRWTLEEASEWLNDLLLRNNLAVGETLRLEWLEKALASFHNRSDIRLELLRFIKAEAARQQEALTVLPPSENSIYDFIAFCFENDPVLAWIGVGLVVLTVVTAAMCYFGGSASPPVAADATTVEEVRQELEDLQSSFQRLQTEQRASLEAHQRSVEETTLSLLEDRQKGVTQTITDHEVATLEAVRSQLESHTATMKGWINKHALATKTRYDELAVKTASHELSLSHLAKGVRERADQLRQLQEQQRLDRAFQGVNAGPPQNLEQLLAMEQRLNAIEAVLGTAEERAATATALGWNENLDLGTLAEKIEGLDTDFCTHTSHLETVQDNYAKLRLTVNALCAALGVAPVE